MHNEIEQFIQSVRRHNPSAKTWRSYSSDLRLFASLTGEVSPNQITPKDIDRFVNTQVERGFKPTTINDHLGTVVSSDLKRGNDKSRQSYIAKIKNN